MPYREAKVYFDGSHYIAIPHTECVTKRRPKPAEQYITIADNAQEEKQAKEESGAVAESVIAPVPLAESTAEQIIYSKENVSQTGADSPKKVYKITLKELFDKLYIQYIDSKRAERRKKILEAMRPYFDSEQDAENFVDVNMERKLRNIISRRIRLMRKINLQNFNYFNTFTYSDLLHSEESFKKGLKTCLRNFAYRKQWKYIGVWERSPKKQRLHFHGIFDIPGGTMPDYMIEVNDYNFNTRKRQITHQNTFFNDRFGRSDFAAIDDNTKLGNAVAYIMKYIEKSGEKIVYSKGLPQYFISDIMDDDILCPFGLEDRKLLLFDDFNCWDEGVLMGKVSKEVIAQMRKSN
jgi:hypothetical protein